MTKRPRYKPTVIQISPHETLVVFPPRPDLPVVESCNPPFEDYKHLLTDWPLRRPYGGEPLPKPLSKPRAQRRGKSDVRQRGARRRKPRAE